MVKCYIGTSQVAPTSEPVDPIFYLKDGAFETWYPGLISSSVSSFAWSQGTEMFALRDKYTTSDADGNLTVVIQQKILKIDMERLGAPEFGRD